MEVSILILPIILCFFAALYILTAFIYKKTVSLRKTTKVRSEASNETNYVYNQILKQPGAYVVQDILDQTFRSGELDHIDIRSFTRSYCHVNDDLKRIGSKPIWEREPNHIADLIKSHISMANRMDFVYDNVLPGDTYEAFLRDSNRDSANVTNIYNHQL